MIWPLTLPEINASQYEKKEDIDKSRKHFQPSPSTFHVVSTALLSRGMSVNQFLTESLTYVGVSSYTFSPVSCLFSRQS